ncbi:MAG: hypothetical protein V4610_06715 [Pseudomonadota bacterium]|jgi:hypothetical protein
MNERVTDQSEEASPGQDNEAVPVLITFALLFLLSAAVWFVLDRIRTDEVRTEMSQSAGQGAQAPGGKTQPSKVATTK